MPIGNSKAFARTIQDMDKSDHAKGTIMLLGRQAKKAGSQAQRAFLDDMAGIQHPAADTTSQDRQHPERRAEALAAIQKRMGRKEINPKELAWLQTLPSDPAQVSFADAEQLAALSRRVHSSGGAGSDPIDARLIDAHWLPVKALHDTRAAQAALSNARSVSEIPVPSSALNALTDAVAEENPSMHPSDVIAQASDLLHQATTKRRAMRSQAEADARAHLDQIAASEADRTATTR